MRGFDADDTHKEGMHVIVQCQKIRYYKTMNEKIVFPTIE